MLNPSRIKFARHKRGWTKTHLAKKLGVQARSVQGYESGEYEPEPERLELLAELLSFPVEFFYVPENPPKIAEHMASFRSMSKMTATLKNRALSSGIVAFWLNDWIEKRFALPTADLPDLGDLSPEEAAGTLRRMWGLGEAPIGDLIPLLESRGIRVFSLTIEARAVDAFSVWHDDKPFVFLNTLKSAEHSRFDAAHQLGHLVRDRHSMLHDEAHSPEMEREANAFASAFLMPPASIIANRPAIPTLERLIELKRSWGVSLAALAYRMNSLGLFTEWAYRTLCMQISKKGFRTSEPNPMRHETSQVLAKVFDALRSDGTQKSDIARELLISVDDLDSLTFGLTISSVPNTATTKTAKEQTSSVMRELRLVK